MRGVSLRQRRTRRTVFDVRIYRRQTHAVSLNYAPINHSYSQIRHTINHIVAMAMRSSHEKSSVARSAIDGEINWSVECALWQVSNVWLCRCDLSINYIDCSIRSLLLLAACIEINHLFKSNSKLIQLINNDIVFRKQCAAHCFALDGH